MFLCLLADWHSLFSAHRENVENYKSQPPKKHTEIIENIELQKNNKSGHKLIMKSNGIYAPVMLYGVSLSRLTFLLLLFFFFSLRLSFRFVFHSITFFFLYLLLFYWAYFEEQSCVEFFRGFVNIWFRLSD